MALTGRVSAPRRPPPKRVLKFGAGFWHDTGIRALLYQATLIAVVLGTIVWMAMNAQDALEKRGVATGFSFLLREAGFPIGESLLPYKPTDSYLWAFATAIGNTLTVSIASIIAATALGLLIGFARLSSNWFLSGFSALYVELFRNTPQLVQLSFWYLLMTQAPGPRQAWSLGDVVFFSNRGLIFPAPVADGAYAWMAAALLAGCAAALGLFRWARLRRERTGQIIRVRWIALGLVAGLPVLARLLTGRPSAWSVPALTGFNFEGGITISPEFLVLFLGLTLYIAAFLAEIVRAGVQSVGRGQIEAARSIGMRPGQIRRKIILPQAMRVMIPPTTSQYVSLIKTSSLGVAIGYPELFNVTNTAITLSGHTIECMALMAASYLLIALAISGAMNAANRLVQVKER
jgi:general L-amino acid transport system permease protein